LCVYSFEFLLSFSRHTQLLTFNLTLYKTKVLHAIFICNIYRGRTQFKGRRKGLFKANRMTRREFIIAP
jgi:hypothetical protein